MGFLDKFRSKPPGQPSGQSGRDHTNGFLNFEELNTDLVGVAGYAIYDLMYRTDPDCRKSLSMFFNPVVSGTWTVVPFGGDDATDADVKAAKAMEWALIEYMKPNLIAHLAEALPGFCRWGHAPFEQIWQPVEYEGETILAPRKLDIRLPRSIQRYFQDKLGELTGIEQTTTINGTVNIAASELVYYRVGAEGDNWEGTSVLRPAYKPFYIKDKLERLDAIGAEREATGFPVLYPPSSKTDSRVLDELEDQIAQLRGGEQAAVVMPGPHAAHADEGQGWLLEIQGLGAGAGSRDLVKSIDMHKDGIAAAVVAEFMRLGQGADGAGARATGDVQQDPFYAGVQVLANIVKRALNETVVRRFTALNFKDVEGPPSLEMEAADETSLEELYSFVSSLAGCGALTVDAPLEDYLRDRAGLPPVDPEARKLKEQQALDKHELEMKAGEQPPLKPGDKGTEKVVETDDPHPEDGRRRVKSKTKETVKHFELVDGELFETFRFDPNQPRDPGGEGGGRWIKVGPGKTWGDVKVGDKFRVPPPEGLEPDEPGYGEHSTLEVVNVRKNDVVLRDQHGDESPIKKLHTLNPKAAQHHAKAGGGRRRRRDDRRRTPEPVGDMQQALLSMLHADDPVLDGWTFGRQDRELRDFERKMLLDDVEAAIDGTRERLQAAAGAETLVVAHQIANNPDADPSDLEDLEGSIYGELSLLYDLGRETVRHELAAQAGHTYSSGDLATFADRKRKNPELAARAHAAAESIKARTKAKALEAKVSGRRSEQDVAELASREATASLKAAAQVHAAPALNLGRSDEADDNAGRIRGVYYTSILDGNRCQPCANDDDDVLRRLDDPVRIMHKPPNYACYGGDRCRCMEFFVLEDEGAPNFSTFDYDPQQPRDEVGRWEGPTRTRPGDYYHELLAQNVEVDVLSDADQRGHMRVQLPHKPPFNGEKRRVKAMMVSETGPVTFAQFAGWAETLHPRQPAGHEGGGRFRKRLSQFLPSSGGKGPGGSRSSEIRKGPGSRRDTGEHMGHAGPSIQAAHESMSVSETTVVVLGPTNRSLRKVLDGHTETRLKHAHREGTDGHIVWADKGRDEVPVYTNARKKLHEKIVKGFLDGTYPPDGSSNGKPRQQDRPTVVSTAGGGASGKSEMTKHDGPVAVPEGSVVVNPDEVKALLPEYKAMVEAKDPYAAAAVHEESSYLSKQIAEAAVKNRYNVLLDVVGDSEPGKFIGKLDRFHGQGYQVEVNYASAPLATAIARNAKRAERTGRKVPPERVANDHREAARRFHEVNDQPYHVRVYDTSGDFGNYAKGKEPVLVYEKAPGQTGRVIDPAGFQRWLDKKNDAFDEFLDKQPGGA